MDLTIIVEELRRERGQLDKAIETLNALNATETPETPMRHVQPKNKTVKHRAGLSAAARRRISIAQKARWARQRRG